MGGTFARISEACPDLRGSPPCYFFLAARTNRREGDIVLVLHARGSLTPALAVCTIARRRQYVRSFRASSAVAGLSPPSVFQAWSISTKRDQLECSRAAPVV